MYRRCISAHARNAANCHNKVTQPTVIEGSETMSELSGTNGLPNRSAKGRRKEESFRSENYIVRGDGVVRVKPEKLLQDRTFKEETKAALEAIVGRSA